MDENIPYWNNNFWNVAYLCQNAANYYPINPHLTFYYFYESNLHLPEVICPEPPEVQDSERVIEGTKLDDVTTYTCAAGMRTDDGSETKTITCLIDETWSETQITCGRECVQAEKHLSANLTY